MAGKFLKRKFLKSKWFLFVLMAVALGGLAAVALSQPQPAATAGDLHGVALYFFNPLTNRLEPETRSIKQGSNDEVALNVVHLLYEGPKNTVLAKTAQDAAELREITLRDGEFQLDFTQRYLTLAPIDELLFKASLVYTLTELNFVEAVHIFVEGQELLKTDGTPYGPLSRSNVHLSPVISPDKVDVQTLKLYFADLAQNLLAQEERLAQVNPNQPREKYVMEQLLAGATQYGLANVIPQETKIISVKTDEGICYVNLSSDFLAKQTGSAAMIQLSVYSIVNSLTELSNVKKVQFWIDNNVVEGFPGILDLRKQISRDETWTRPPGDPQ
jgi:germination protein M